jgi:hypothetical protein
MFLYRNADTSDVIRVELNTNGGRGMLFFYAASAPGYGLGITPVPLPERWLDSTNAAAIAATSRTSEDLGDTIARLHLAEQQRRTEERQQLHDALARLA